jgi:hypothetical protein
VITAALRVAVGEGSSWCVLTPVTLPSSLLPAICRRPPALSSSAAGVILVLGGLRLDILGGLRPSPVVVVLCPGNTVNLPEDQIALADGLAGRGRLGAGLPAWRARRPCTVRPGPGSPPVLELLCRRNPSGPLILGWAPAGGRGCGPGTARVRGPP